MTQWRGSPAAATVETGHELMVREQLRVLHSQAVTRLVQWLEQRNEPSTAMDVLTTAVYHDPTEPAFVLPLHRLYLQMRDSAGARRIASLYRQALEQSDYSEDDIAVLTSQLWETGAC